MVEQERLVNGSNNLKNKGKQYIEKASLYKQNKYSLDISKTGPTKWR
jgi:hypothetical protein